MWPHVLFFSVRADPFNLCISLGFGAEKCAFTMHLSLNLGLLLIGGSLQAVWTYAAGKVTWMRICY